MSDLLSRLKHFRYKSAGATLGMLLELVDEASSELDAKDAEIERLRKAAIQFVDDVWKIPCPRDTNGDGGCGRRMCPICGEDGKLFALINRFRAELNGDKS